MNTNANVSFGGVHPQKKMLQHNIGSYEHGGPQERLQTPISLGWIVGLAGGMFSILNGEPTLLV